MVTLVLHAHLWGGRQRKYDWLNAHEVSNSQWAEVRPHSPSYWFVPRDSTLQAEYEAGWKITDAMRVNVLGFQTHRDHFAIDFDSDSLMKRIAEMRGKEISDVSYMAKYAISDNRDWQLTNARQMIRNDSNWPAHLIRCAYRPFDYRATYFSQVAMDYPRRDLMDHIAGKDNLNLNLVRQTRSLTWQHIMTSNLPTPAIFIEVKDGSTVFPLYLYYAATDADRNNIQESVSSRPRCNLAPEFVQDFSGRLKMSFVPDGRGDLTKTFGAEDAFAYIYGVFHSLTYRTRYAEFLKIDFPRVPLASNADLFRALCEKGQELVDLHLMRDERLNNPSFWGTSYPVAGAHDVTCVDCRYPGDSAPDQDQPLETGRVFINKAQPRKGTDAEYFDGVPPEVWEFRIGGYQVLDHWLKERKRHKRCLTLEDIEHFQKVVAVLRETIRLMAEIDDAIEAHGGWPIK